MNNCNLVGRVVKKPELRYTVNNIAVTTLVIAIKKDKENADFLKVIFWNKLAENISKYLDKGNLVAVSGRLENYKYTKEEKTYYETRIIGQGIQFLSSKNKTEDKQEQQDIFTTKEQEIEQKYELDSIEITDEDLPF